jgi:hypothetical protein
MAGYGIECILKALILSSLPRAATMVMLNSFRGGKAHDYEWLRTQYLQSGGAKFSREITEAFALASDWSTDMRYLPRTMNFDQAEEFLDAAETIIQWADGRL